MRNLTPPNINFKIFFQTCVNQTGKNADKAKLTNLADQIIERSEAYIDAFADDDIDELEPIAFAADERKLVANMYKARLRSTEGVARPAYDQIRTLSSFCPYCGFGETYEVEHYLHRAKFPEFNIFPMNLLPVCHPCNHIKLDAEPVSPSERFLHPYFDQLPNVRWLIAEILVQDGGPILVYSVLLNGARHRQLFERMTYHFTQLKLGERMAARASQILQELEYELDLMFPTLDTDEIKDHFQQLGERSFRLHGNTLETAAYFAAASNEDYCAGMYKS